MKQADQIIELLSDTSFPQVVLLDGGWGSGKTHFIRNHLIERIEQTFSQKVYFFSLYGISSIDDFRDKIISLSLTDQEEASVFAKFFAKGIDGAANNLGERGVGAVISGAAGAYKYKLYGELNNCVLILDDLERVADEKLVKNILGECLSLAESKDIRVVCVANEDKLDCKSDVEKVFADKYKFSFTHEEVVDILKNTYESIDEQLANELLLNITSIDSRNIRVLKRAIAKFTRIKSEIENIDNFILDQALSRVLGEIIRICCAKFEYGFSKEQIIDAIDTRIIRQMAENTEESENSKYERLDNIFSDNFYGVNKKLISYCCDGLFEFDSLKEELNLPIKQTLLDSMKSIWAQNQLSVDEFTAGVTLLEENMSTVTDIDSYQWFSMCDIYLYMLDNKIIESSKYSKEELLDICKSVEISRFTVPIENGTFDHDYRTNFYNEEVSKAYYAKKDEIDILSRNNKYTDFSQRFIKSWSSVQNEAHQSLMHTAIYQDIGVEVIRDAILCWSNEELFQFVRFNRHRYRFANIQDFFQLEIETLKEISAMLVVLSGELGFGLKVASIEELHTCFVDACRRMETNLGIATVQS
ncbi:P-loop NTPase fold protein [Vibrio atlanticus]|uniref:KAP family P-loop domain protein n=1 Tax=Vibrio atlanticus TaxID=693153 RepID=A0A1C3J5D3_9VIBR|nr:P-loop NTPase fold protein [Vibrio atlanticus]SBS68817.1 KAP family P-loop domain protein [Vibrio atlanticus]